MIFQLQNPWRTGEPGDQAACVGLILDALDDAIDSHAAVTDQAESQSIKQPCAVFARKEDAAIMMTAQGGMQDNCIASTLVTEMAGSDRGCADETIQAALLWGLRVLQASANSSQVADQQIQGFLMQHGPLLSSLSPAVCTAMQDLITSVQAGNRIGLALLANAQAEMLGNAGSLSSLKSLLQNIYSSADTFEEESCSIAREVERRGKIEGRPDGSAQAGETCSWISCMQTLVMLGSLSCKSCASELHVLIAAGCCCSCKSVK